MRKLLPVGYEDLREIVDKNLYYVDKTFLIKELVDRGGKVNLFTRPRRFGKTLNLSMLRRFFERELSEDGNWIDNGFVFDGLMIQSSGERYLSMQQKFPVIFLTMKSAKQPDFELAYASLVDEIGKEYRRHSYILESNLFTEAEKSRFQSVMNREAKRIDYAKSLEFLSYCLTKYIGRRAILLIDEYDVPLENAFFQGYYERMSGFIRSLLESVLKTNPYLEFAVITGCLRISKESIFTGLNNLEIFSGLSMDFCECFGFTEQEVVQMLEYYDIGFKYGQVKEWYDGYRFGESDIYNPWSIVNYVKAAERNHNADPKTYWSNTSSNSIVRELIENADLQTRKEIEDLLNGESIEKPIHEDLVYEEIRLSKDSLWSFLFFTGYLKKTEERMRNGIPFFRLAIPNEEVRLIYQNTVIKWFEKKAGRADLPKLCRFLEEGKCDDAGRFLSDQLLDTISFYDYSESYYHGFLSGLLKSTEKYLVISNMESGMGRPDLILKTRSLREGTAIILEIKVAESYGKMDEGCLKALEQIEANRYEASLFREGYQNIRKFGICFYRKECLIKELDQREP